MKKPEKKITKAKPLKKTVAKITPVVQSDPLETAEAKAIIKKAVKEITQLEGKATTIALTLVEIRFEQGCYMKEAMQQEGRYGKGLIKKIADDVKMTKGYLYQLYKWASDFKFDIGKLQEDFDELMNAGQKISVRHYLKKHANPDDDAANVGGEDEDKERLLNEAERGARAMETAQVRYGEDLQVQGVKYAFNEALMVGGAILLSTERGKSKPKPGEVAWRNDEHAKFVRTLPCCCGCGGTECNAHHVVFRSEGASSSDLFLVPLTHKCHMEFHAHPKTFERDHKISFGAVVVQVLQLRLEKEGR